MSWFSLSRAFGLCLAIALGGAALTGPARADVGPLPSIQFEIYEFEALKIGTSNGTMWALQNVGTANLVVTSVALQGQDASAFSMTSGCDQPVLPGQWCSGGLSFAPRRVGTFSAQLVVTSNGGPASAQLLGAGSPLSLLVGPNPVSFGEHTTGTSTKLPISVTNTDKYPLPIPASGVTVTGDSAFSLTSDGCSGTTLAATGSCALNVTFAPTVPGSFEGQVRIPVNGTTVVMSGSAVSPPLKEQTPVGARATPPRRIKLRGITTIARPNPTTTARMPITTRVIAAARKTSGRYLTVIQASSGATKVRTYGRPGVVVVVVQTAAQTVGYLPWKSVTVYVSGKRL